MKKHLSFASRSELAEQQELNKIDLIEQRMNGKIKTMNDQFPGDLTGNMSAADILESDKEAHKNQMESVSCVAVMDGSKVLMGIRKDNGKWTFPGGHLNQNEDPEIGAKRELFEEAGIRAQSLEHLKSEKVTDSLEVHAYKLESNKHSTPFNDPDKEVDEWKWIDYSNGLPSEIANNLHVPMDQNVLMKSAGITSSKEYLKKELTR